MVEVGFEFSCVWTRRSESDQELQGGPNRSGTMMSEQELFYTSRQLAEDRCTHCCHPRKRTDVSYECLVNVIIVLL